MRLVYDPMTDRRKQPAVGGKVAKHETVVSHNNMRRFGDSSSAVNETLCTEKWTLTAEAIMATGRDHLSGQ